MKDFIISKEELVNMFENGDIKDENQGWTYLGTLINIIAIHENDPKYIFDITDASKYKITQIQ